MDVRSRIIYVSYAKKMKWLVSEIDLDYLLEKNAKSIKDCKENADDTYIDNI